MKKLFICFIIYLYRDFNDFLQVIQVKRFTYLFVFFLKLYPANEATIRAMGAVLSGSPVLIPLYSQKAVSPMDSSIVERDVPFQQLCSLVIQIVDYETFRK
jgi:hypothetical protein